jgi:uncharacterized protein YybS (DUF2232 family)
MTPGNRESLRDVIKGSSATLVLFLAYAVFPLIGTPAGMLAPFPALFYSLKQGRAVGVAITLITLAVLAFTEPMIALLYLLQAGLLSLLLAEFVRRGEGGARSIAGAVAGCAILTVGTATGFALWSGVDLNLAISAGIASSIAQTGVLYQKGGFSGEELAAIQEALKQSGVIVGIIYPAVLLLLMVVFAGLNLTLLRKSSGKLLETPKLGSFSSYRNPEQLVWLVIVSGFCLLLDHPVLFQVALNTLIVTLGLYLIQGLAIIITFFDRFAVSPLMRGFFYVLLVLQPYLAIGVALLGLFDLWLNFRTPKTGENL